LEKWYNDAQDIFVRDTLTNTTARVSVDAAGNQANNQSNDFSISADGRFVAFNSYASNLVPGDTNDATDIFVRDTLTNTTLRVSVDAVGNQVNSECYNPSISADGRRIAFDSEASNLVPGDTNETRDIFVSDIGNTLGNNAPSVNDHDIITGVEKKDVLIGLRTNNIIARGGNRGNDVFVLNVAAKFEIDPSVYFAQFQDIAQLIDGLTFGQLSISPAPQDPLIEVANGGKVLASLIALLFISWTLKILFRSKV
jgi:Tol biopolymer transport system component